MSFREEIAEEQQLRRLKDYLDGEIKLAEYENHSASALKSIRDNLNVKSQNIERFKD